MSYDLYFERVGSILMKNVLVDTQVENHWSVQPRQCVELLKQYF